MKTLTVDDRHQIELPGSTPGQVYEYKPNADGTINLVPIPLRAPKRIRAKMVRQGDKVFFQIPEGYTMAPDAIGEAVREERESRS
jgi:hypothetical protein